MNRIFSAALVITVCLASFLPAQIKTGADGLNILKFVKTGDGKILAVTRSRGFFVSTDNGLTWTARNNGLPLKIVYPFRGDEHRELTSLYADPVNNLRIAVTTSSALYVTEDGGWNWKQLPTGGEVRNSNYFTSVAMDPGNPSRFLLGTSFNGIYETSDSGETWKKTGGQDSLYVGAGFYEEISGLAVGQEENGAVWAAAGFGGGLFKRDGAIENFRKTEAGPEPAYDRITGLGYSDKGLQIYSGGVLHTISEDGAAVMNYTPPFMVASPSRESEDLARQMDSSGKKGIYVNSFHASGDELDAHFEFMKAHGLDSMVVDMKDDEGIITYATGLELPNQIGAVRKRFDLKELIRKADENGIYLIGRIVVFKDPVLYSYEGGSYAIWDSRRKAPWGNLIKKTDSESGEVSWVQYEYWVDPYSEFVWRYNLALAEELQELGVDEIQFDYIRFPSDGDLSTAVFRSRKPGMIKTEALESFMRVVREKIFIPVSTDLYGFNSWYRMGNWIGQDIDMLADYVDVVSPMFYPSHFPSSFLGDMDYLDRAGFIYREGTRRASVISGGRALIRPYVQAFLIGNELKMEYDEYTKYLDVQLSGIAESGGDGYTMWNNSNRYYMVRKQ